MEEVWERRGRAYGLVTAPGELPVTARWVEAEESVVLAACAGLSVPLMVLAEPDDAGPGVVVAFTCDAGAGPGGALTALDPDRPLAVPAAAFGGHARWILPPDPTVRPPTVAELATALAPLV